MNPLAPDPSLARDPEPVSTEPLLDGRDPRMALGDGIDRDQRDHPAGRPIVLAWQVPLSALGTLLAITVARQIRGRRLPILVVLFALPIVLAVLARRLQDPYRADEVETILIFGLIPQALLPLTALLLASGMVQDDVEEQTLTYLLIRPIPRWLIYVVQVTATWLVTSALASVCTTGALVAVHWGSSLLGPAALAWRALLLSGLLTLSLLSYVALFGGLGVLVRRSLVVGVGYIVVFEGVMANIDFVVRHLTVMYYLRTLSVRWLGLSGGAWSIDPATAPSVATCLVTLLAAGAVFALLGACIFSGREFRMKTPEGS